MHITFAELREYPVVRVEGDLTRAEAGQLKDALQKVAAEQPVGILCDLRGLGKAGDGLTVLHVVLDGFSPWLPGSLVLLTADPALHRRLTLLRIARRATVVADLDEALEALRAPPQYLRASLTLASGPDSVAVAEVFVESVLTAWQAPLCLDPARLITSELVGNAVTHARGELRVHVSAERTDVTVAVGDRGAGELVPALREGGLGLVLVDEVSRRWGVLPRTGGGHLVWAQLRCRRAQSRTS
jgi:signal transduction histidine kinase